MRMDKIVNNKQIYVLKKKGVRIINNQNLDYIMKITE